MSMIHQLETNPHLMSPEYWHGHDISNPSQFVHEVPQVPVLGRLARLGARDVMQFWLTELHNGGQYDERVMPTYDDIEKEKNELYPGALLVVDRETLLHQTHATPNTLELPVPDESVPAITEPYVKFWQRQIAKHVSVFGSEMAVFPEQRTVYLRDLYWGIAVARKNKQPVISILPFDLPSTNGEDIFVPEVQRTARFNLQLPLDIGMPRASVSLLPGANRHVLTRNRAVHVIDIHADDPPAKKRAAEPALQRLKQSVRNLGDAVLPRPVAVPGLGTAHV